MNVPGVATSSFPSKNATNAEVLYASLGTFWTHVFQDKGVIKGLSIAQSEELIQRYYDFVDAVATLSVKDVPELHRERWYPIKIKKSELRLSPLLVLPSTDPDVAVFGPQPLPDGDANNQNNRWHYGETFQFGKTKRPLEEVYVADVDPSLKHLPLLVNRIVAPTQTLVHGVDYLLVDGQLKFNKNPFLLPETMKYALFNEEGEITTFQATSPYYAYTDTPTELDALVASAATGTVQEEELVLWAYHAQVDTDTLYKSFGYIFDFKDPDPVAYKNILKGVVNLFVEGPTVQALTSMICAFLDVESTEFHNEVVVDAYTVTDTRYVVTDKRVYTAPSFYHFSDKVYTSGGAPKAGAVLPRGPLLFDAVEYFDPLAAPGRWSSELIPSAVQELDNGALARISLPPHMFIGSYHGVLIFEDNDTTNAHALSNVVTVASGVSTVHFPFPADVDSRDAASFNAYLNQDSETTAAMITEYCVGNANKLNPLDFIFRYFLRTNTALIKLRFTSVPQLSKFMKFFKVIQDCLPKHVYLMFYFDFSLTQDVAALMSNAANDTTLGSDSSNQAGWVVLPTGSLPPWRLKYGIPTSIDDTNRQFVIGRSLDLSTIYTNGYGVLLRNLKGLSGNYDIVADLVDTGDKYVSGTDLHNIPLAYKHTGTFATSAVVGLSGSGSKFLSELRVGDLLYSFDELGVDPTVAPEYRRIVSIETDTDLVVDQPFSGNPRTLNVWAGREKPSMVNTGGLIFWLL